MSERANDDVRVIAAAEHLKDTYMVDGLGILKFDVTVLVMMARVQRPTARQRQKRGGQRPVDPWTRAQRSKLEMDDRGLFSALTHGQIDQRAVNV